MLRDAEIRSALLSKLRAEEPEAALFQELPLQRGTGRADCAAVNGSLIGYEIKSDRDSLVRLERQIECYESVFDYSFLVITSKHRKACRRALPAQWGIWLASGDNSGVTISPIRRAKRNRNAEKTARLRLLWYKEVSRALRERAAFPCGERLPVRHLWNAALAKFSDDEVAEIVRDALKARRPPEADSSSVGCGG